VGLVWQALLQPSVMRPGPTGHNCFSLFSPSFTKPRDRLSFEMVLQWATKILPILPLI
jgi:hypothetical protein